MSVYGGFVTRIKETTYNRAIYNMLCLLQMKVCKSYKQGTSPKPLEHFDDLKFAKYFTKFYQRIAEYDKSKHLPPRFSFALKDLARHFGVCQQLDAESSLASAQRIRDDSMSFVPTPRTLRSIEEPLPRFNDTSYISLLSNESKQLKNVNIDKKQQPLHYRTHSLHPYFGARQKRSSPTEKKGIAKLRQFNYPNTAAKPGTILFQRDVKHLSLPSAHRIEGKLQPVKMADSFTRRRSLLVRTYTNNNKKRSPKIQNDLAVS
eukprot:TRINITY_DN6104_c0_g2_i3.p1 TRINITY_DN6104_c0_g2~~TRINITY_DN6104_c0_g2_i3.p1  ORF type:complete len:304 (+),score=53.80 TRINITY_DN6104_c0_g2_i3:131-913(+)